MLPSFFLPNNAAERRIKPFVIGRKNWLFNQTPRGAKTSALLYSLVQTAVANNLEPFAAQRFDLFFNRIQSCKFAQSRLSQSVFILSTGFRQYF
jgi:hypothetical protein